jgi:hypothetical protein
MMNVRVGASAAVLVVALPVLGMLVLVGVHRASAQGTEKNPLALVKSLKCTFPVYSLGSWKGGDPQAQIKQGAQFSLTIDQIDTDSGSGRVNGTSGPVEVTALLTVSSLHFMERSVTGTLNVTTVFVSDAGAKTFRAVHSRHDYLPMSIPGFVSEPSVSQNYGTCEAGQ